MLGFVLRFSRASELLYVDFEPAAYSPDTACLDLRNLASTEGVSQSCQSLDP